MLILLLVSSGLFAQTSDAQAERAKKAKEMDEQIVTLLDRTISEAGALKLAQNRVVILGLAGDLYWRYDQGRARELFRTASGEVLTFQAESEKERLENIGTGIPEIFDGNDPRIDLLTLVGMRDAELGLELMAATRTPAIAAAMAAIAQQRSTSGLAVGTGGMPGIGIGAGSGAGGTAANFSGAMDAIKAGQEINLEQMLITRAAANDPEKAAKAIKESLAKGISMNVVPLLTQILQKDEKLARGLGDDVIAKITGTDLSRVNSDLNGAISFLQYMTRTVPSPAAGAPRQFNFSDAQARDVATKLTNTFLMPSPPTFVSGSISRAIPMIEKVAPDKVLLLKQKDAANKKAATTSSANGRGGQPARQWNPADTPEQIIAAAGRITNARDKAAALQAAVGKIGQIADEARAKRIIDSIPDERLRAQAQNTFDANRINRMTAEGKLDEAKASVGALTNRRSQIQRLVALATQYQRKNTEKDREIAASLLVEARTLAPAYPEDEDELTDYMELLRGYAVVEPDQGFRMIEPLIDQFNDYIQASATLSRYNKRDRSFKKGEMMMRINGGSPGLLPFRFLPQIQSLARADVDRMSVMADRFQRSDARTLMKLYILQGYQRGNPPPPPPAATAPR